MTRHDFLGRDGVVRDIVLKLPRLASKGKVF